MITIGDAILFLRANSEGLDRQLGETDKKAKGWVGGMGNILSTGIGVALGGVITGAVGALGSVVSGVGDLAGAMVTGNAEFERYETQFGVLLGSADAAKERLAKLAEFGAKTPFELPEVVQADKILQGFGLHAIDAAERFGFSGEQIRTIAGDLSAGTGVSFQEMATTLGKFASGATGEAISRFQELGIVTRSELADMGLEFSKSGQLITPVEEAFGVLLTAAQDKFGGMMEAQSSTFEGMMSNFEDFKAGLIRTVGAPLFEIAKQGLGMLLEFLNSAAVQGAIQGFVAALETISLRITNIIKAFSEGGFDRVFAVFEDGSSFIGALAEAFGLTEAQGNALGVMFHDLYNTITSGLAQVGTSLAPLRAALGELFAAIFGQLPPAQSVMETVMAAITAAVNIAASFIAGTLIPALTAAVNWVVTNWPQIQATIEGVLSAVQQVVTAVVTGLLSYWTSIFGAITENTGTNFGSIQTTISTVIATIQTVITTVLAAIAAFWEAHGAQIVAGVTAYFNIISAIVTTVINVVFDVIRTVLSAVQTFWQAHGTEILTIASFIWGAIQAAITTAVTLIQSIITTVMSAVQAFWQAHGEAILTAAKNTWDFITTTVQLATQFIGAIIDAFAAAIRGDWTAFGEHLRTAWDTAWLQIQNIITTVRENIETIIGSMVKQIIAFFTETDWGAVGADLIEGIKNGILGAVGGLADAAANAARAALAAAKGALGIKSPSKVAEQEVGAPIGEGMFIGAQKALDQGFRGLSLSSLAAGGLAGLGSPGGMAKLGAPTFVFNIDARGSSLTRSDLEDALRRAFSDAGEKASNLLRMAA